MPVRAFGHQPGELARLGIVFRQVCQRLGPRGVFLGRLRDTRAAKQHDGGADVLLVHAHLGLEQFQLQPHRAQRVLTQKFTVGKSQPVGRGPGLRRVGHVVGGFNILTRIAKRMFAVVVFHVRAS